MERDPVLDELLRQRLKSMKSTADIDGYLHGLFKEAVNEMLKAEMDNHLGYEKHSPEAPLHSNSRNGKTKKTIKTTRGELEIEVPRDREGTFEPQLVPKRKRVMEEIEYKVLSLYSHGMSTRDIESAIREMYWRFRSMMTHHSVS